MEKKLSWLRLIRSHNVGPIVFWELLKLYGEAEKALDALPALGLRGGRKLAVATPEQAFQEYRACQKQGVALVAAFEPEFPSILYSLPDCPPFISVKGDRSWLQKKALAIVGARNASLNGCRFTHSLARKLGEAGWVIVSGLARGIDRAAHEAALATGTVSVLAGGVDQIYPLEHEKLYHSISKAGALLSEMPLGTAPTAHHFPRRNRLISGLAHGVIIVEAALKSGSMITARCAAEQGREVFAVPGSPLDPRSRGVNSLIKDGACLIENADDVLKVLEQASSHTAVELNPIPLTEVTPEDLPELRQAILNDLDSVPLAITALQHKHSVSPGQLSLALLELELAGKIQRLTNQMVARVYS